MIGQRIKKLREEKEKNQEQLAKDLSISASTVAMYETEKRQPNHEMLIKLSEYFNVSIDYLLGKTDIKEPLNKDAQEFYFAYHKEIEGLTEQEIKDALRFYKQMKKNMKEGK